MHDTEVPGAPVRILSLEEGDEPHVPHEVEDGLRSHRDLARDHGETDAVLRDLELREAYAAGRAHALHEREAPTLRLVHSGEPVSPPPTRPTVVALAACVLALLVVECVLMALRVGGAVAWDWDWGWVLAPLWLPTVVGTITVMLVGVVLAALDERDTARRRRA